MKRSRPNVAYLNVVRTDDRVSGLQMLARDGLRNRGQQKIIGGWKWQVGAPGHTDIS
jgi:hypothetical protein